MSCVLVSLSLSAAFLPIISVQMPRGVSDLTRHGQHPGHRTSPLTYTTTTAQTTPSNHFLPPISLHNGLLPSGSVGDLSLCTLHGACLTSLILCVDRRHHEA